ncbi:glycosyltransferase [Actinomyces urinae]|uniref:glycosyltransferase n=1 Tax=Actinomyces urinae TaxID=1689268 RepID=UPI000930FBE7|nr:glycosyltransferase [Actinomyces urinae]
MILTGLIVSRIFAPEPSAASLRLKAVKRGLEEAGSKVRVFTTEPPVGIEAEPDSTICRVPVLRDKEGYVKGYLSYASFDIQAFLKLLTMPKVDFILVEPPPTTGTVARVACTIRRIPYFWYAADVWSDATDSMDVPGFVKKTVRNLETFAVRGARGCIAVSDGVAQRVQEMGAKSVAVVPNGADTELFNPEAPRLTPEEKNLMRVSRPYFIYAGTASGWQGAELFANAFEKFWNPDRDVQFLYLTRGDSVPELEKIADRLAKRAQVAGADYEPLVIQKTVPPQEAASWQSEAIASCVSIQPGIGYDLAYPTKALTALSCGTSVLYAGVGPAIDDIEDNDLGICVPYCEESVLEAMETLLNETRETREPQRLHKWVEENRSMKAVGKAVANYIADRSAK